MATGPIPAQLHTDVPHPYQTRKSVHPSPVNSKIPASMPQQLPKSWSFPAMGLLLVDFLGDGAMEVVSHPAWPTASSTPIAREKRTDMGTHLVTVSDLERTSPQILKSPQGAQPNEGPAASRSLLHSREGQRWSGGRSGGLDSGGLLPSVAGKCLGTVGRRALISRN